VTSTTSSGRRFLLVGELDLVTADHAREPLRDARDERERCGGRVEIANCPPIVQEWFFGMVRACRVQLATSSLTNKQRNCDEHRVWRPCASQAVTAALARGATLWDVSGRDRAQFL
jgi:hypothetical protein